MISNKEKYDLYRPKKFLGQNFLVDKNIANKIVNSLEIKPGETVIEIGPGQGVLTELLCGLSTNFFAVEIDKSIFEKLNSEYGEKIKLIHDDFLNINLNDESFLTHGKIKVIGNIPYNLTSEILFKLFESSDKLDSAVMMMQKEVACRLTANPGTKDYGILAINTQLFTLPKILFNVPPTAFFPKPKVVSSVVKLDFIKNPLPVKEMRFFKTLVKESFGKRRKIMKNSLKNMFELNNISFESIDFDFSRRAESVSIKEYIELANEMIKLRME